MATVHTHRAPRPEVAQPLPVDRSHLKVVRSGARGRPQIRLTPRAGVTLVVLLFAALFLVAVSHALLIESQVRLDDLDAKVAKEQTKYEDLRQEIADLESPARIQEAAAELGMVPAGDRVWITPDQATAPAETEDSSEDESPDTSNADVKPYLGSTP
jgi:cell division protein FtsL